MPPSFTSFFFVPCLLLLYVQSAGAASYQLTIGEKTVDFTGERQTAIVANDTLPAPTLHWRDGEDVTVTVTNHLREQTSIHWHGIILPYQMDGVPGISFDGIEPGQSFTYRFRLQQSGTYWYHGHSGMQEQQGLLGALIVAPAHDHTIVDRDYVVILSDWPDADPYRIMTRLKQQSDYYNFQKRTVFDFFNDIRRHGFRNTVDERLAWGDMRMDPTDLADVTGATYRFLVNGRTPAMNWTALFKPGDKVRLRFVNASAMTYFDVRIPGLTMRVIEADGQKVMPVDVEQFRIAVAETYDVLVEPEPDRAYRIFAEAMDRSGYAAATLTPRSDLQADLPPATPRTLLTLADMGPMHGGHAGRSETGPDAENFHSDSMDHSAHTGHGVAIRADETALDDSHAVHRHSEHKHMGTRRDLLGYQDLMAADPNREWRPADREITLRLTGNMNRYIWAFDDLKYSESEPIRVRFGDHIRFNYVNETMMNHPIHLHGLWQILDTGQGIHNPRKHVINVPPGKTVSVVVIADNEGDWAFHCHLLYHMESGMFRKLIVEKNGEP
jgi:CopA family copper-resistance protein